MLFGVGCPFFCHVGACAVAFSVWLCMLLDALLAWSVCACVRARALLLRVSCFLLCLWAQQRLVCCLCVVFVFVCHTACNYMGGEAWTDAMQWSGQAAFNATQLHNWYVRVRCGSAQPCCVSCCFSCLRLHARRVLSAPSLLFLRCVFASLATR